MNTTPNYSYEGSFGALPLVRQAKLNALHEMNDEMHRRTGDRPYVYANCPNTDDGSGVEYFHFQGDACVTGIDAALVHMQKLLTAAGGTQYGF